MSFALRNWKPEGPAPAREFLLKMLDILDSKGRLRCIGCNAIGSPKAPAPDSENVRYT